LKNVKNIYLTPANRFYFNSILLYPPDIRIKKHVLDTFGHFWTPVGHFEDAKEALHVNGLDTLDTLGHYFDCLL